MFSKYKRIIIYFICCYFAIIAVFTYIGFESNIKYFFVAIFIGFGLLVLYWLPSKNSNYEPAALTISIVNVTTKDIGDEIALFVGSSVIIYCLHEDQTITSTIEQVAQNLSNHLEQEIDYYYFKASSDSWDWHQLSPYLKQENMEKYLLATGSGPVFTRTEKR